MATDEIASLTKFCSAETALKILNSQSLRWSAPHLHNDPFEPDYLSGTDFTPEGLLGGMIKHAVNMLFGPNEPTGKSNKLVAAVARWRDEERFGSEEEAEVVLKQLLGQIAEQQQTSINDYMERWQQFSRNLRICSFSDKPTNMAGWQRFADNHSGIALRFSCGADTALPKPKRINYSSTPPLVTSLKEQVAVTYGQHSAPGSDEFINKLLVKGKDCSVEKEFRCFASIDTDNSSDDTLWYTNKKFSTPELTGVYFGLATANQDKESILKLVKEKYPRCKVYRAEAIKGRYELNFVPQG